MNRAEIERDHWVERYLAGRLSDADARQFEAYWVENPEVMRELEACARLKGGLVGLRGRGELDGLVRPSSWWPGRLRLLVLAACAVFAVVGLATLRGVQGPRAMQVAAAVGALPDHAALVAGERYTLLRLRSASSVDAVIELPLPPAALELRVLPEMPVEDGAANDTWPGAATARGREVATRYLAQLAPDGAAGGAAEPAVLHGLRAGSDGFVALFVDSRTLAPGRYRLRLAPEPTAAGASAGMDAAADRAALAAAGQGFVIDVVEAPDLRAGRAP